MLYSDYEDGVFLSTAAAPIVYRGMTIGGIYICDWDNTQGTLLMSLQQNLRTISLVLMVIALLVSFFFSKVLTSRIGALLRAIRIVGEGEYGHRLQPAGRTSWPIWRRSSTSSPTAFRPPRRSAAALSPTPPTS